MANTLTVVIPQLLAQGLLALREQAFMPLLVNRGYSELAGEQGSAIDIPIPSAIVAQDVTPGPVPPTDTGVVPTKVTMTMDKWKEAPFGMTDKDKLEVQAGYLPKQANEAIKALANQINTDIFALYKDIYGYTGTAGTTPFVADTKDATNTRVILNKQLAPMDPRHFVLNPDGEGNALNLRAFQDMSWSGSVEAITNANLNKKLGFQWWMHQLAPTHTAGTITTGLISKAATAYAVGVKTLLATTAASTGAAALVVGDIITFAGDAQTYVLTAAATQAVAASDVTLAFEPGLKVAHTGSEAVSVKASHAVNLAFHPDAFAFASRPLQDADEGLGMTQSVVDEQSGLTLRLEVSRQHKQTRYSYDILYGVKTVRAALGARLAG